MKSLGQIAYEAYCESRNWKSYDGKDLPSWETQNEGLRYSWYVAARAVKEVVEDREVKA